jgi:methyl-accepting chemotaxis protein
MAFLVVMGAVSYGVLTRQQTALEELYQRRFGSYQLVANSGQALGEVHSGVYRLLSWMSNLNPDKIKQIAAEQGRRIDAASATITGFSQRPDLDAEERKLVEAVGSQLAKYKKDMDRAITLAQGDMNLGVAAMQTADADFEALLKVFNELVQLEGRLAQESYQDAAGAFTRVLWTFFTMLVLALALSFATTLAMSRRIIRPLRRAIDTAGRIAVGDLTSDIAVAGSDETAELLAALKAMRESLLSIVDGMRSAAQAIAGGTRQLASGNADLSQRTEEQASSLEQTASSMDAITSTVKQNAENARQANQLAIGASEVAVKGGRVVGEVVQTMTSINESSRKIADIIGVIDGIAFQTNILALNAAVEAARAGEQGRGFAVVATEVRTLAQRSAAAAKEIKALIGDSVEKVDKGTRLVDAAGKTMEETVRAVKRVTDIMAEITAASEEQSTGIEQVNKAVAQMEKVTQQNAALVEEAAAAGRSLQDQAQHMEAAVAAFNLGRPADTLAASPGPAAAHPAAGRPPSKGRPALAAVPSA